jgi:hypothetical protein
VEGMEVQGSDPAADRQAAGPASTSGRVWFPDAHTALYSVPSEDPHVKDYVWRKLNHGGMVLLRCTQQVAPSQVDQALQQAVTSGCSTGVIDDIECQLDGAPVRENGRFVPRGTGARQQVVVLQRESGLGSDGRVAAGNKKAGAIMKVYQQLREQVEAVLPDGYEVVQASLMYNDVTPKRRPGTLQVCVQGGMLQGPLAPHVRMHPCVRCRAHLVCIRRW